MLDSAGRPIDGVYGATDGPTAEKTGNVTLIGIECRRGFLLRPPPADSERIRPDSRVPELPTYVAGQLKRLPKFVSL